MPTGDPGTGSFHDYVWTVPAISTEQARIKVVQDNSTVDYQDISDANFTINSSVPADSGACCFPTDDCAELSLVECSQQGGLYMGDFVDCSSVECGLISCCEGVRGDMNSSGAIDVSDLTYLVDYLFSGGPPPPCDEEADINGSGAIDVSD